MTKPNFFIVGAPKCGTSALFEYLSDHSQIFVPLHKEPHYFADDYRGDTGVFSQKEAYLSLFKKADPTQHLAFGEGSVFYLSSNSAIANIAQFNPQSRIIIMLRHPVEMLQSLHKQLSYVTEEDQPEFSEAWALQEKRAKGECLPPSCLVPMRLQYGRVARYGSQLQNVFQHFPKSQVKIILYEDFRKDVKGTYQATLDFLGLKQDGRTDFPIVNERKEYRSAGLQKFFWRQPKLIRHLVQKFQAIPVIGEFRVHKTLARFNIRKADKTPLDETLMLSIIETYRPEMEQLGQLLERDMSYYMSLPVSAKPHK